MSDDNQGRTRLSADDMLAGLRKMMADAFCGCVPTCHDARTCGDGPSVLWAEGSRDLAMARVEELNARDLACFAAAGANLGESAADNEALLADLREINSIYRYRRAIETDERKEP